MTKRTILTLLTLLLTIISYAADTSYPAWTTPKHEVRAVWLTTIGGIDWPHSYAQGKASIEKQKRELCNILDQLQTANINTILLQTRIRGTVIYPSDLEPWDGCLSGKPGTSPGYDALQFAIDECHRRGMELHAWVVTIPVGKCDKTGAVSLRKKQGSNILKIGPDAYMNPESKQTADYLERICAEITERYDVDGIHLDYIRYPETWKKKVDKPTGRRYITRIVEQISKRVKGMKPWIKMSCSPIGKHDDLPRYWSHGWNARTSVCQDAQEWLRLGLMDQLYPMMYFKDDNFYPFAADWQENCYGRTICAGLGIYFLDRREKNWPLTDITREMHFLRQQGTGHCFFRSKFFTDNTKGIYDFTAQQFNIYPALVPPMTWMCNTKPQAPSRLSVHRNNGYDFIGWMPSQKEKDGSYIMYNVYASRQFPVDIDDARNLIKTNVRSDALRLSSPTRGWYYAITSVDRYGNESEPIQERALHTAPELNRKLFRKLIGVSK